MDIFNYKLAAAAKKRRERLLKQYEAWNPRGRKSVEAFARKMGISGQRMRLLISKAKGG